jgi:hypothetical protein
VVTSEPSAVVGAEAVRDLSPEAPVLVADPTGRIVG